MVMPLIDALPLAPTPADTEEAFDDKAYETVAALGPFVEQANALAVAVEQESDRSQTEANRSATQVGLAAIEANRAQTEASRSELEADRSQQAADDAVAVVSGGDVSIKPDAGKIPIAGADATIQQAWIKDLEFELDALRTAKNQVKYGDGPYPSLDLQFAGAKLLDPRVNFTRASKDWGFDENGVFREYDVDEPVFDYDPATGEALGLRVWGQRSNLLPNSSTFTGWTSFGATLNETDNINIYGDSFYKLASTANDTANLLRLPLTYTGGEQEVGVVVKKEDVGAFMLRVLAGTLDVRVGVDIDTLAIALADIPLENIMLTRLPDGSVEVRVRYTPDSGATGRLELWVKSKRDASVGASDIPEGQGVLISSCFLSTSRASPYIPTKGSQVTVAETSSRVQTDSFSLNRDEFTIACSATNVETNTDYSGHILWVGRDSIVGRGIGVTHARVSGLLNLRVRGAGAMLLERVLDNQPEYKSILNLALTYSKDTGIIKVAVNGTVSQYEYQERDLYGSLNYLFGSWVVGNSNTSNLSRENVIAFNRVLTNQQLIELTS